MLRVLFVCILILLLAVAVQEAWAYTYWNGIRASALLPDNNIVFRAENTQGGDITNTILYNLGGIQEVPFNPVDDGPQSLEATIPGPISGRRYYGFRLIQTGALDLLPVRLEGVSAPAPNELTRLAEDPTGDEIFGYVNLDLTDCRVSRDGSKLYAALTNSGGGFPLSSGLTFFSYLLGINNPTDSDPDTVLALIYTIDFPGIIEPGLYQINGTGVDDLVRIGEISANEFPADDTIVLSCELADLEANAFLQTWYNPGDPQIGVAGFSQKITALGGALEADSTPGGIWHLREEYRDPESYELPSLHDFELPDPGSGGYAGVVYTDSNGNCPVYAEIVFDDIDAYPLRPQSLDYGGSVEYHSDSNLPPIESGTWSEAVVRFSDNLTDVVELTLTSSGVLPRDSAIQISASPNPFSTQTAIEFTLPEGKIVEFGIFDVSGRWIAGFKPQNLPAGLHALHWDGLDTAGRKMPPGIYLYRLRIGKFETRQNIVLLR
ncbi:T9SS type A sorting domain-containing protein [bacterium]|nr:T9SS type A sorting domain-containing protein [bacterium]MBU1702711.1 T9SS type A sorting domain-containing protein [Candidatus Eisenbacteria bacterium]MBU1920670.1 T9SS type A sorting domain-containing protein [bacterium]